MKENEVAIKTLEAMKKQFLGETRDILDMAINALYEIQQYRAYKEIFESHFTKEALELLSDKEEFGKWLERGKWIAKKCDEINRELEAYRAIGTIEELQALKEKNEPKKPIKNNPIINKWWSKESRLCPVCNGIVSRFGDNYCPKCGQKLDWGE